MNQAPADPITGTPIDEAHLRLNVLWSFHYYKATDVTGLIGKFKRPPRIFVDSGAWSAFSQGATIDLAEYIEFVHTYRHLISVYCNLDDLRDPAKTWANQKAMEAEGLTDTLPVVHMGEPLDWLVKYLDDGYRYIGLGRMVGRQLAPLARWLIKCFELAEPYGAVFHGLGMTRWKLIQAFPFYSIDSSSWCSGFRFGAVPIFDPYSKTWVKAQIGDPASVRPAAHALRAYGVDPVTIADRRYYHGRHAAQASGASVKAAELYLREIHGPIELPGRSPGVHQYLAQGGDIDRQFPAETGVHYYLADGDADRPYRSRSEHAEDGVNHYLNPDN